MASNDQRPDGLAACPTPNPFCPTKRRNEAIFVHRPPSPDRARTSSSNLWPQRFEILLSWQCNEPLRHGVVRDASPALLGSHTGCVGCDQTWRRARRAKRPRTTAVKERRRPVAFVSNEDSGDHQCDRLCATSSVCADYRRGQASHAVCDSVSMAPSSTSPSAAVPKAPPGTDEAMLPPARSQRRRHCPRSTLRKRPGYCAPFQAAKRFQSPSTCRQTAASPTSPTKTPPQRASSTWARGQGCYNRVGGRRTRARRASRAVPMAPCVYVTSEQNGAVLRARRRHAQGVTNVIEGRAGGPAQRALQPGRQREDLSAMSCHPASVSWTRSATSCLGTIKN